MANNCIKIGRLREKLALVWEVAVKKVAKVKEKMVRRAEPHVKERHFSLGDQMLVRVVNPNGMTGGMVPTKWLRR